MSMVQRIKTALLMDSILRFNSMCRYCLKIQCIVIINHRYNIGINVKSIQQNSSGRSNESNNAATESFCVNQYSR